MGTLKVSPITVPRADLAGVGWGTSFFSDMYVPQDFYFCDWAEVARFPWKRHSFYGEHSGGQDGGGQDGKGKL